MRILRMLRYPRGGTRGPTTVAPRRLRGGTEGLLVVTRIRSTRSASSAEAEYPALRALQSFEHSAIGIRERFLTPVIGGGRTIAVLAEPLGEARSTAWVLCHGFGQD